MKTPADYDRCAERLKALADPNRLRLVQCLFAGPSTVSNLCDLLGIEIVNVSHHLGVLRNAGLVQAEREGRHMIYSLPADIAGKKTGQIDLGCCCFQLHSQR